MEELIDRKIVLSMRAIYQSKLGLHLMDKGMSFIFVNPLLCHILKFVGHVQWLSAVSTLSLTRTLMLTPTPDLGMNQNNALAVHQ